MSKGQRGNKESKKPKQATPAAKPVVPGTVPLAQIAPAPVRFKR
jgi:hypothetical protein